MALVVYLLSLFLFGLLYSLDVLHLLLKHDADTTAADGEGNLPLSLAVRGNHPECVEALLSACHVEPSRIILFANQEGDNALFVAEQMNVVFCKRAWSAGAWPGDHEALALSNAIVQRLLTSLTTDGTPLASVRHVHDCFARGSVYADKGK